MIEARIFERPDRNYARSIMLFDGSRTYNFITKKWIDHDGLREIPDDCFVTVSDESYRAIAEVMGQDRSIPKPEQSFVEGKLEATEKHLEDMRSIVFEKEKTDEQ